MAGRPVPIILFYLPIILFRISQNILLLILRIDPIILNYSHKNSEKLNDNIATQVRFLCSLQVKKIVSYSFGGEKKPFQQMQSLEHELLYL